MCDTKHQTRSESREAPNRGADTVAAEPAPPKVCSCDKPCCRSKLIKQATTAAGQDS